MKTFKEIEREAYMSGNPLSEEVLTLIERGENMPDSVGDISAGFPEEGCLSGPIETLKYLIQYTHKNNKLIPDLKEILKALEEKQQQLVNDAEYGYSELKNLKLRMGI